MGQWRVSWGFSGPTSHWLTTSPHRFSAGCLRHCVWVQDSQDQVYAPCVLSYRVWPLGACEAQVSIRVNSYKPQDTLRERPWKKGKNFFSLLLCEQGASGWHLHQASQSILPTLCVRGKKWDQRGKAFQALVNLYFTLRKIGSLWEVLSKGW